jgi:hypothetical protein
LDNTIGRSVSGGDFVFMGKKRRRVEKRYIEFPGFRFQVPAADWGEYLRHGFAVRHSERVARPRAGVRLVWEEGRHMLKDSESGLEAAIPSSWRMVIQAWLFKSVTIKAAQLKESPTERQERILFEAERERQNEAVLWRTSRDTKGANEFAWIDPAAKVEMIGALRQGSKKPESSPA